MIEPVFNELTFTPLCISDDEVEARIDGFANLLRKLKNYGITHVRVEEKFNQIPLKKDYSLNDLYLRDYLSKDSAKRNRSYLLAGMLRHPSLTEDIERDFYGSEDDISKVENCLCTSITPVRDSIGLFVASILNSFAVGFKQSWIADERSKACEIEIVFEDKSKNVKKTVFCATEENDDQHPMFVDLMSSQPDLCVVSCDETPEKKVNRFPTHHGMNECKEYAEQIAKCKYVTKVFNTIDHNADENAFIHRILDNGIIEIRMTWTTRGLGLVLGTTGRNKVETTWIAKYLEEKYKK